ncbi:hypothetical protein M0R45_004845 [Rubus argutus]|uniref:Legume lectin domain-containing protein n=1 Tax=Rubus argutus TaxID=59490 RepID=A0AAW1YL10_RUBAR
MIRNLTEKEECKFETSSSSTSLLLCLGFLISKHGHYFQEHTISTHHPDFPFVLLPFACSIYFQIPHFEPNAANILYQGDAVASAGAIELINKVSYTCRVGWANYAEKVPLWDSNTGRLTDFTTHYSFVIDTQGSSNYGHGIAFFLAPVGFQIPPNSAGGFLGLFNTTPIEYSPNQIILVEFDSYVNQEWDPPYEHVGINNNSIASAVTTPWNASTHSGDTTNVWIGYNSTTKNLSVHWSYQTTSTSTENTSLWYQIDLMKILPEWITIGFSAATGSYVEINTLVSWEFNSTLDIKDTSRKHAEKRRIIVGSSVSGGVLVAVVFVALIMVRPEVESKIKGNHQRQKT